MFASFLEIVNHGNKALIGYFFGSYAIFVQGSVQSVKSICFIALQGNGGYVCF